MIGADVNKARGQGSVLPYIHVLVLVHLCLQICLTILTPSPSRCPLQQRHGRMRMSESQIHPVVGRLTACVEQKVFEQHILGGFQPPSKRMIQRQMFRAMETSERVQAKANLRSQKTTQRIQAKASLRSQKMTQRIQAKASLRSQKTTQRITAKTSPERMRLEICFMRLVR